METQSHLSPSGAAKSSPASLYIDEPKEGKIIHFTMKIPVKIKLPNPLSPNNFTLSDKRLNSLKQVSQKYQRAPFPQSWNNPLSPTQFQISGSDTRYAIFEGKRNTQGVCEA